MLVDRRDIDIQISSDNIKVTDSMRFLVNEKLEKVLEKIADVEDDLKSFRVVLNKVPDSNFETKIDALINGKRLFASNGNFVLETSIIGAVSDLRRQVKKLKSESGRGYRLRREMKRFKFF